jgi:hypothetical protein
MDIVGLQELVLSVRKTKMYSSKVICRTEDFAADELFPGSEAEHGSTDGYRPGWDACSMSAVVFTAFPGTVAVGQLAGYTALVWLRKDMASRIHSDRQRQ